MAETEKDGKVTKVKKIGPVFQSPIKLLIVVALSIFIGETMVMLILAHLELEWQIEFFIDSSLLIILMLAPLYFLIHKPLNAHLKLRKQVEQELVRANEELRIKTESLTRHNLEITLINQMNEFMQTCKISDEAYKVLDRFLPQIFPASSGAVYIVNSARNLAESKVVWGECHPLEKEINFTECWAIRLGKPHYASNASAISKCDHMVGSGTGLHYCVPFSAGGDAFGVFYLFPDTCTETSGISEQTRSLVDSVARIIDMELSNLRLRETLSRISVLDPLTGLYNRRYLEVSMERELNRAERNKIPLSVIMLDLDNFKEYNDYLGHRKGDDLLTDFGEFMRNSFRGGDIVCRYGGDEFFIVLPDTSSEGARLRAEKLREDFKALAMEKWHNSKKEVALSLGVASYPQHGNTFEALVKASDYALYEAKNTGKNKVCVSKDTETRKLAHP